MKRPPSIVSDLRGGEVIRCHAGLVRITHRMHCSHRWALLLRDDMSETDGHLWLAPTTRVLEVLRGPAEKLIEGARTYNTRERDCWP